MSKFKPEQIHWRDGPVLCHAVLESSPAKSLCGVTMLKDGESKPRCPHCMLDVEKKITQDWDDYAKSKGL